MHPSPGAVRRLACASAALAGLLLLAACSSSGPGSSGQAPADAGATTSAADVASAQSFVKQYEHRPAKVNVTPLPAAPKRDTIAIMNATSAPMAMIYSGVQQAAALVGWKAVAIPFDPTNQPTLIAAMNAALTLSPKPVAVVVISVPQVVWAKEIPKYKAAGIAIITFAAPTPVSGPVKVSLEGALDAKVMGRLLANWVIADSGGKADVLLVGFPDIGLYKALAAVEVATFRSGCPGCSITPLNLTLTQLFNGANNPVVSALQSHPDIKYVVTPNGQALLGLDAALQTAGISGVKVAGAKPVLQELQSLARGDGGAWITSPYAAYGYLMVDAALRIAAGIPIPDGDGGQPVALLTKDNVGTGTITDAAQEVPENYKALYAAAWKVSG
jgi:ABC-type sugar transport system substrate-binding protein